MNSKWPTISDKKRHGVIFLNYVIIIQTSYLKSFLRPHWSTTAIIYKMSWPMQGQGQWPSAVAMTPDMMNVGSCTPDQWAAMQQNWQQWAQWQQQYAQWQNQYGEKVSPSQKNTRTTYYWFLTLSYVLFSISQYLLIILLYYQQGSRP